MTAAIIAFVSHYWVLAIAASHAIAVWAGHKWASMKAAAKADLTSMASKL